MTRQLVVASIALCLCIAQEPRLGLGVVVAGTVTGEDGTKIVEANIAVYRLPPYPKARLLQTKWSTVSRGGGVFRIEGLPEGQYRLCAELRNSNWLNPCEWGLKSPTFTLSGAQPTVNLTVVLKKGVAVPIRLDDPGQLLSQSEGRTHGAHLLLGVPNDAKVFRPATVVSRDALGRTQQIVVPFNYTVTLVVYSSFFRLSDKGGAPLPATSTRIPIAVPLGATPTPITLRVTGGK